MTEKNFEETFGCIETDSLPIRSHYVDDESSGEAWAGQSLDLPLSDIVSFCQPLGISEKSFLFAAYAFLLAQILYEEESIFLAPYPVCARIDFQSSVLDFIHQIDNMIAKTSQLSDEKVQSLLKEYGLHPGTFFSWDNDSSWPEPPAIGQKITFRLNCKNDCLEARVYFPYPEYTEAEALCMIHGYRQVLSESLS